MKTKRNYRCMVEDFLRHAYIPEFRKRLVDAGCGNIRAKDFEKIFMDVFCSDDGPIDVMCQSVDNLLEKLIDYEKKSATPKIFIPVDSLVVKELINI